MQKIDRMTKMSNETVQQYEKRKKERLRVIHSVRSDEDFLNNFEKDITKANESLDFIEKTLLQTMNRHKSNKSKYCW